MLSNVTFQWATASKWWDKTRSVCLCFLLSLIYVYLCMYICMHTLVYTLAYLCSERDSNWILESKKMCSSFWSEKGAYWPMALSPSLKLLGQVWTWHLKHWLNVFGICGRRGDSVMEMS